jgi:small-conductance mechanosensitive channel
MLFEPVRQLGASVLASAGVIGIIVGFAAQRTIANLFAGFQLALTQPIRIDDVVIVENEWGRIEEITLTYVVVRIWDLRRLIVPLSYFIERPFQNWTRAQADLLGTVFLYTDYTIPVDTVREELNRIVGQSKNWDGKVCGLQVTNATERTLELRALASAADSSRAWDLRCEIREKLVFFVQRHYPESLPRQRSETRATITRVDDPAKSKEAPGANSAKKKVQW